MCQLDIKYPNPPSPHMHFDRRELLSPIHFEEVSVEEHSVRREKMNITHMCCRERMFTSSSCTSSAFEMISFNFLNIRHHHDHHRFNLLLVPTTGHVIDEQLFFCLHHLVRHHPKFLCTGGGRIENYGVCGCESQINLSPFLSFSSEIKSA